MAALFIGQEEQAAIRTAIERARARPLPWDVGRQMMVSPRDELRLADRRPGAPSREQYRPEQVLIPVGYRAMVSFEEQPGGLCMHLSVSVERTDPKLMPSIPAVRMIAAEFGIDMREAKIWIEEYEPGRRALNLLVVTKPREIRGHA